MVARILKIQHDGLVLVPSSTAPVHGELWLPRSEWGETDSDWDRDVNGLLPGDEFDIVVFDDTEHSQGRILVSRKAFTCEFVDDTWLQQPRIMRVEAITRDLIKGRIGAVPAFV